MSEQRQDPRARLLQAMGDIDEQFILEAEPQEEVPSSGGEAGEREEHGGRPARIVYLRRAGGLAAACLILILGMGVFQTINTPKNASTDNAVMQEEAAPEDAAQAPVQEEAAPEEAQEPAKEEAAPQEAAPENAAPEPALEEKAELTAGQIQDSDMAVPVLQDQYCALEPENAKSQQAQPAQGSSPAGENDLLAEPSGSSRLDDPAPCRDAQEAADIAGFTLSLPEAVPPFTKITYYAREGLIQAVYESDDGVPGYRITKRSDLPEDSEVDTGQTHLVWISDSRRFSIELLSPEAEKTVDMEELEKNIR